MPPVIGPIIGWMMVNLGVSFAVASAILSTTITLGASFALGAVTRAIAGSPHAPKFAQDLPSRSVSIRQPLAPRRIIYGAGRYNGIITAVQLTGSANDFIHLVYTLTGRQVAGIDSPFFDGVEVPLDPTPDVNGYLIPASGNKFRGFAFFEKKLGAAGEAAFPGFVAEAPSVWTSAHRQDGCASVHVKLKFDANIYPNGVPDITFQVRGCLVVDPRDSSTAYSTNAANCVRDYFVDAVNGLGVAAATELDDAQNQAAANSCDESVALNQSPVVFEKRYTCNGSYTTDMLPQDILQRMLSSCAGTITYVGGQWAIWPAVWRTPTVSLGDADARAALQVQTAISKRDLCNAVKGVYYANGTTDPTDFPGYFHGTDRGFGSDDYLSFDGGIRIWRDVTLPFTNSPAMAQRIAKVELERTRRQKTVTASCKMSAYAAQVATPIYFSHPRWGWSSKTFEVDSSRWVPTVVSETEVTLGVDLVLREADANIYAWTSAEELASAVAPTLNLPDTSVVAEPSSLVLYSGVDTAYTVTGQQRIARIHVTWTSPPDIHVTAGGRIFVEFKKHADSTWKAYTDVAGNQTEAFIDNVDIGGAYDVRIYAQNVDKVNSGYVTISNYTVTAVSSPADYESGAVTIENGFFEADLSTDPDGGLDPLTLAPRGWLIDPLNPATVCSYETASPIQGKQSLKLTGATGPAAVYTRKRYKVSPNEPVHVRAMAEAATAGTASVIVQFYDNTDTIMAGQIVASTTSSSPTAIEKAGTAPSSSSLAYFRLYLSAAGTIPGTGNTSVFDSVEPTRATPPQSLIQTRKLLVQAQLSGASLALDFTSSDSVPILLNTNTTITGVTNAVTDRMYLLRIVQDGSGGRTLTVPAGWRNIPAIATAANAETVIYATWDGTNMIAPPSAGATVGGGVNVVAFSATPTFDLALGAVQKINGLTGNITGMTISNAASVKGQRITFVFVQDGTGSRSVVWDSSVKNGGQVADAGASATFAQNFVVDDAGNLLATDSGMVV